MPQKRWRIDGNFVASPGEFLLQGNPTVQRTHCALVNVMLTQKYSRQKFLQGVSCALGMPTGTTRILPCPTGHGG